MDNNNHYMFTLKDSFYASELYNERGGLIYTKVEALQEVRRQYPRKWDSIFKASKPNKVM